MKLFRMPDQNIDLRANLPHKNLNREVFREPVALLIPPRPIYLLFGEGEHRCDIDEVGIEPDMAELSLIKNKKNSKKVIF